MYAVAVPIASVFYSLYTPVYSSLNSVFSNWKIGMIFYFGVPAIIATFFFLKYVKPNDQESEKIIDIETNNKETTNFD